MTIMVGSDVDRLVQAAHTRQIAGDSQAAIGFLTQALRLDPTHLMALIHLAKLEIGRRDHTAAMRHAERALAEEPHCAPALEVLAHAHWLAGKPAEGLTFALRAMDVQPGNPDIRLTAAHLCIWLARYQEAEALLQALLAEHGLETNIRIRALNMRGELDIARGRFTDAVAWTRAALALNPDRAATHLIHGLNLLRLGLYEEGWRSHARRPPMVSADADARKVLPGQAWTGQDLRAKTLLLNDDQGFGDAIQFFRYLPLVHQLGPAQIVLHTFPALHELFAGSTQIAHVMTALPPDLEPDFHCLTTNLPGLFSAREDTIPAAVPYVRPHRLAPGPLLPQGKHLNVGLVWSGDPRHPGDHLRSIPADPFLRLTRVRGVRFYCLQNWVRPRDIAALEDCPTVERVGERFTDFAQTATVVSQLDLVITVDTSVAHLAGALGKPVWILLPRAPDWRWLTEREDSPWYPTARLFRAGATGWGPVLTRVQAALRALTR